MTQPADGWIQRDAIGLHYLEWRPDRAPSEPPILLLHGLSSNAHYWDRVASLIPSRRVIALDQRGHGLTGRPPHAPVIPAGYATEELLADATRLIDDLGLAKPVIAGHSWGATIALELAARHPSHASALVFVDGPMQSASNLFSWDEAQGFMQPPLPRYSTFAQAVDDARRDFAGAWGDDLEPFVMARLTLDATSFVLTLTSEIRLELLRGLYESPVDQLWLQLEMPAAALLARGGPARVTDWREAGVKRLRRDAPAVEVKWFDTPHDIPLFAPAAIAAEIERAASAAGAKPSETTAAQQL